MCTAWTETKQLKVKGEDGGCCVDGKGKGNEQVQPGRHRKNYVQSGSQKVNLSLVNPVYPETKIFYYKYPP